MRAWVLSDTEVGLLQRARRLACLPDPEQRLAALDRFAALVERAVERRRVREEERVAALVEEARREGYLDGLWEA